MDLLIKNMEMPSCCYACPLVYDMGEGNYACPFFNGYAPISERRDDCPLVEVPPHGDLIAKGNVLFNLQVEALSIDPNDKDFEGIKKGLLLARKAVLDAKPVITSDNIVCGMQNGRMQITENLKMAEQIVKEMNTYGTDN